MNRWLKNHENDPWSMKMIYDPLSPRMIPLAMGHVFVFNISVSAYQNNLKILKKY